MFDQISNFRSMNIKLDYSIISKSEPHSVKLKSRSVAIEYGLDFDQIYTWLMKGWSLEPGMEGQAVYYICEKQQWVPVNVVEKVDLINPN